MQTLIKEVNSNTTSIKTKYMLYSSMLNIINIDDIIILTEFDSSNVLPTISTNGYNEDKKNKPVATGKVKKYTLIKDSNRGSHRTSYTKKRDRIVLVEETLIERVTKIKRASFEQEDLNHLQSILTSPYCPKTKKNEFKWGSITEKLNNLTSKVFTRDQVCNLYYNSVKRQIDQTPRTSINSVDEILSTEINEIVSSTATNTMTTVTNYISDADDRNISTVVLEKPLFLTDWTRDEMDLLKYIKERHGRDILNGGGGLSYNELHKQFLYHGKQKVRLDETKKIYARTKEQIKNKVKYLIKKEEW